MYKKIKIKEPFFTEIEKQLGYTCEKYQEYQALKNKFIYPTDLGIKFKNH